ncbi:putative invertase inhibitor [Ziziphus jujuba]|uniref:Invertase inhibitor n=1 Tax=Ziziphus jujuba TaxID=326968 RepID=A0A6P3ZA36_ZIZJJ|nr:putative invertase inhibitor [Ziziphus jujuba]
MKPISSVSPLILVCLFLTEFHVTNARGLIKKACETSLHKGLCLATIKADRDYKGAKLHDLGQIVLKAATSNASALQKEVEQLLKERASTSVESALKDCKENYDDAVSQLEKSKQALEHKRYNDVNTWVTAAMNDADSCEQGLKESADKDSSIAQKTFIFGQLCSNVLAVTNKAAAGATRSV